MISSRRQIARLERLTRPAIERRFDQVLQKCLNALERFNEDGLTHASNLCLLLTFGNPHEGESLLRAWDRCRASEALEFGNLSSLNPFDDIFDACMISLHFRQAVLPKLNASGNNDAEKLAAILSQAPGWLLWSTYADLTFAALDSGSHDAQFGSVANCYRSRLDYVRWPLLPREGYNREIDRDRRKALSRLLEEDPECYFDFPTEVVAKRQLRAILERYGHISGFKSPLFIRSLQTDPVRLQQAFDSTQRHWILWH